MDLTLKIKKDIKEFIEKMGFSLLEEPRVEKNEDRILVSVFVDEPRSLIGEKGANLYALQHVVRIFFTKKHDKKTYIDIDVNGYKNKRYELIKNMAISARHDVLNNQQPVEMEPMNAFDRRIVHTTLQEYPDIKTESVGEGSDRRVSIHLV